MLVQRAIQENKPRKEVAVAAIQDAIDGLPEEQKEALARDLYKEATGRFPQSSSDRRAVYTGGFWLLGIVFVLITAASVWLVLCDKQVPEPLTVLATALVSGVTGGLFGYAKQ